MRLRYCTVELLETLKSKIARNLDWYYSPSNSTNLTEKFSFREATMEAPELSGKLAVNNRKPSASDASNALKVYEALPNLTPHQASIERMWTYLCHFDCPDYVAARWLSRRPENKEEAVRKVRNHFFASGNRGLIRDNGLSRLWWLGKIAYDVDPKKPGNFLDLLLHRQDVRSALIERPSVSMNQSVLSNIYNVMQKHWSNGGGLFRRDVFRSWMVALNRRGGVVLLDALPQTALAQLLEEEADKSIAQATALET